LPIGHACPLVLLAHGAFHWSCLPIGHAYPLVMLAHWSCLLPHHKHNTAGQHTIPRHPASLRTTQNTVPQRSAPQHN
jgi:hypothetical protein